MKCCDDLVPIAWQGLGKKTKLGWGSEKTILFAKIAFSPSSTTPTNPSPFQQLRQAINM